MSEGKSDMSSSHHRWHVVGGRARVRVTQGVFVFVLSYIVNTLVVPMVIRLTRV